SHWLQHVADRSPGEARQIAELAHRSPHLEESEQAHAHGEISLAKLERISHWVNEGLACRSVGVWPEAAGFVHAAEGPLLGLAAQPAVTVRGLDQAGRRLRYTLDPARQEKEYQDRYAGRGARLVRGMDDSFHLEAWGDEASGDVLRNALDAFLAPPGRHGEERTSYQRTHDALVEMCQTVVELPADQAPRRTAGAAPVAVVVGLDLLQGQSGASPAVSEYGTLWPASAVRAQAGDCALRRVVLDPASGAPLDVGRSRRLFSPAVRAALMARRQRCAWQGGCDRPIAWCQVDHKVAWWDGGASDLSNAQPLCRFHNLEKEHRRARERGWGPRPGGKPKPPPPPLPQAPPPGRPGSEQRKRPGRGARPSAAEGGSGEGSGDPDWC
ncbi:HNH endonuclease signature motif containing protein, partial [Nocardiopsis rhodophaea]|uniref:HNH endonuclease signature motif containing protein n=1 Tax=Nocardiopsis rhodophaea TaxID=280238 RepID=UPI0031D35864